MILEPYIFFDGQCEAAMAFYKSVFGGELNVSRYEGSPIADDMPADYTGKVMHSNLSTAGFTIMASDRPGSTKPGSPQNVSLSFATTDEAQGQAIFDQLAVSGSIRVPLARAFWGGTFGMLTDRFGVAWMVSVHQS